MAGTMRAPRSRGVLSGVLLVLLGLWGGLIPFVGPYTDFAFTPDKAWHVTDDRLLLSVAPAVATVLGGLIVLASANRALAMFGAWLAALGGAWFVVGGPLSVLWDASGVGSPLGGEGRRVAEQLTFFSGLGALVVFFAALALGRFAVIGVKEARLAEEVAEYDRAASTPEDPQRVVPDATGPQEPSSTQPLPRPQGRYARPQAEPPPFEQPRHDPQPMPYEPPRHEPGSTPYEQPRHDPRAVPPPTPTDQRVAGDPESPGARH